MAVNLSVAVRNARLDVVESTMTGTCHLKIFSGAKPTATVDADPAGLLADIVLPADWMNAAANGQKTKLGTWEDLTADGTGIAASFRVYDGAGVCHMQGTVDQGAGDLSLDNKNLVTNQKVTITGFTWNEPNA